MAEKKTKKKKGLVGANLGFSAAEAYKLLRTNLLFAAPGSGCRIIGVTSSIRSEGKSLTATNLAYTLSETGKRVLIIDSDMRIPTVAKKLGLKGTPGLSNVLAGLTPLSESIQHPDDRPNWCVLPAGDVPPNPSELLGSERMHKLLEKLAEKFDFIIIDLPPVNVVADALVISPWVDGLLLVVRENFTDRQSLAAAMAQLEPMKEKVLGFVLNGCENTEKHYGRYKRSNKYYKSGYGYGYGYGYGHGYGYGYGRSREKKQESPADIAFEQSLNTDYILEDK